MKLLIHFFCAVASAAAVAAPVGDALSRPAVLTRHASESVLIGAANAGSRVVAVGERGIAVISDDGGKSWRQVPVPVSVTLTAVRFADAKHGFAVGHAGTVLSTADGGATWSVRLDGKRMAQLAVQAARADTDPAVLKAAERLMADGPDKPLLDVLVMDRQRALVVGAYGLAFSTEDGGASWSSMMSRLDNPKGLHLYAVRARASRVLIAGEQGLVLASDDGGKSFRRLSTPYKGSFFAVELGADGDLLLAGLRGNAWRSKDGGVTWSQLASPLPVSITASTTRPNGSVVLVNQAGMVLSVRDGALVPINATPTPPLNGVLAREDGTLIALSIHGPIPLPAVAAPAGVSK